MIAIIIFTVRSCVKIHALDYFGSQIYFQVLRPEISKLDWHSIIPVVTARGSHIYPEFDLVLAAPYKHTENEMQRLKNEERS